MTPIVAEILIVVFLSALIVIWISSSGETGKQSGVSDMTMSLLPQTSFLL
jgi:hypothetical protein